jgi:hypothetical protein
LKDEERRLADYIRADPPVVGASGPSVGPVPAVPVRRRRERSERVLGSSRTARRVASTVGSVEIVAGGRSGVVGGLEKRMVLLSETSEVEEMARTNHGEVGSGRSRLADQEGDETRRERSRNLPHFFVVAFLVNRQSSCKNGRPALLLLSAGAHASIRQSIYPKPTSLAQQQEIRYPPSCLALMLSTHPPSPHIRPLTLLRHHTTPSPPISHIIPRARRRDEGQRADRVDFGVS